MKLFTYVFIPVLGLLIGILLLYNVMVRLALSMVFSLIHYVLVTPAEVIVMGLSAAVGGLMKVHVRNHKSDEKS